MSSAFYKFHSSNLLVRGQQRISRFKVYLDSRITERSFFRKLEFAWQLLQITAMLARYVLLYTFVIVWCSKCFSHFFQGILTILFITLFILKCFACVMINLYMSYVIGVFSITPLYFTFHDIFVRLADMSSSNQKW